MSGERFLRQPHPEQPNAWLVVEALTGKVVGWGDRYGNGELLSARFDPSASPMSAVRCSRGHVGEYARRKDGKGGTKLFCRRCHKTDCQKFRRAQVAA